MRSFADFKSILSKFWQQKFLGQVKRKIFSINVSFISNNIWLKKVSIQQNNLDFTHMEGPRQQPAERLTCGAWGDGAPNRHPLTGSSFHFKHRPTLLPANILFQPRSSSGSAELMSQTLTSTVLGVKLGSYVPHRAPWPQFRVTRDVPTAFKQEHPRAPSSGKTINRADTEQINL